jgi:hypothetical protein
MVALEAETEVVAEDEDENKDHQNGQVSGVSSVGSFSILYLFLTVWVI